jgi:hypothetical protein
MNTLTRVVCHPSVDSVILNSLGQGGKASLADTADSDILEYILVKLAARIAAKARTFLVKVKTHRKDP